MTGAGRFAGSAQLIVFRDFMVRAVGLEPTTNALKGDAIGEWHPSALLTFASMCMKTQ
jgi:hypothetical protein